MDDVLAVHVLERVQQRLDDLPCLVFRVPGVVGWWGVGRDARTVAGFMTRTATATTVGKREKDVGCGGWQQDVGAVAVVPSRTPLSPANGQKARRRAPLLLQRSNSRYPGELGSGGLVMYRVADTALPTHPVDVKEREDVGVAALVHNCDLSPQRFVVWAGGVECERVRVGERKRRGQHSRNLFMSA